MEHLTTETLSYFNNRFSNFYDALIRKIEVSYKNGPSRSVSVWIDAQDSEEKQNEGWVCVCLTMENVSDFRISDKANMTAEVLSNGIHVLWSDALIGVDFGGLTDQPETMDELSESGMFVVSEEVKWQVQPYVGRS